MAEPPALQDHLGPACPPLSLTLSASFLLNIPRSSHLLASASGVASAWNSFWIFYALPCL
jgi:hypothetical protein